MSFAQRLWSSTGSADRPMTLALRLSNSGFIFAMVPSSVVHTGVKSLGCENRIAHLSPIHWWKSIWPSVVCAWKLGAVSPMRSAMACSLKKAQLYRADARFCSRANSDIGGGERRHQTPASFAIEGDRARVDVARALLELAIVVR